MARFGFPLLSPFKKYIWEEFDRRSKDFGLDYPHNPSQRVDNLRGPRNAWARVTSNAIVEIHGTTYEGMVFNPPDSIEDMYGLSGGKITIGHDTTGQAITIDDKGRKKPAPGVTSVSVGYSGGFGSIKQATIKWTAHSMDQIDAINEFFLNPGITVMVEFGWGNIQGVSNFNLGSDMLAAWKNRDVIEEKIASVNGNYDAMIGMITNFNYTMTSQGTFECSTQITTVGETMLALQHSSKESTTPIMESDGPQSFSNFFEDHVSRFLLNSDDPRVWNHIPRRVVSEKQENESELQTVAPEQQDWTFITWGYLEELINTFIKVRLDSGTGQDLTFGEIDSKDVVISGHPRLISTNGDVLMIPNSTAPKYKDGTIEVERQDLSVEGIRFPESDESYSGKLINLFINVEAIRRSIHQDPLKGFLNSLLAQIQAAGVSFWRFQIRSKLDQENVIEVVDMNYTGLPVKEFIDAGGSDDPNNHDDRTPFLFRIDKSTSFVKDFGLESELPAAMISTIVYSRAQRESDPTKDSAVIYGESQDGHVDLWLTKAGEGIIFKGDRILNKSSPDTEPTEQEAVADSESKREWDPSSFWVVNEQTAQGIVTKHYAYPNDSVVNSSLYTSRDPLNNRNNNILIELAANITIDGIGGLRVGDCFMVDVTPRKYRNRGVFQVTDITHDIQGSTWITQIVANFRIANMRE